MSDAPTPTPAADAPTPTPTPAAPPAGQPATPAPTPAAVPAHPTLAAPTPSTTPDAVVQTPEGFDAWPDGARAAWTKQQAENARLIRENGDQRIAAKRTAAKDGARTAAVALAKSLGIQVVGEGDEAPTVESVQALAQSQARDAAIAQAAWQNGVNPAQAELLAFKISRNAEAKALDPSAPDFAASMSTIVQAEIARDATLVGQVAVPQSSVELGGAKGSDVITPEAFGKMSVLDRQALYVSDKATYDKLTGNAS